MNQFAGYTPYFGSMMANYQPNQQMPTNLGDPLIQKLLQQQVQQQIMSAFAPQNAGQDFFSMLTGGAPATGAPAAVADVIKKKKQSGGGTDPAANVIAPRQSSPIAPDPTGSRHSS